MKATPFLEEILFLVAQFLRKSKHEDLADQLQQRIALPTWIEHNNPLIKKGLAKIVKEYVKIQPKLQEYYENRRPQSQEQEEEEIVEPKRKRSSERLRKAMSPDVQKQMQNHNSKAKNSPKVHAKVTSPKNQESSWMSKFQKPKRLEDIHHDKIIEEKVQKEQPKESKVKSSKKQKKVKIQSSDYESDEDSFELEPKKKLKKQVKAQKVQTKQKQNTKATEQNGQKEEAKVETKVQPKVTPQQNNHQTRQQQQNNSDGPRKFFSRINVNELEPIKNELLDNSFEAKAKFGQAADEWGKFGYEKLKDTRGDSFKKTKGKLKNRAFQGNLMDVNLINSIPIL